MSATLSLVLFAFTLAITPGPNNMMLLASGSQFGLRRTIPLLAGIVAGRLMVIFLVGLGMGTFLERAAPVKLVFQAFSVIYLIWLSYRIAMAPGVSSNKKNEKPSGFVGGALFQWLNPKGWATNLSAASLFLPDPSVLNAAWLSVVMSLVGAPCLLAWTLVGDRMQAFLTSPTRRVWFQRTMAGALLLTVITLLSPS